MNASTPISNANWPSGLKVEEALRASEAFYHLLVETLPQNILRKNENGPVYVRQSQVLRLTGQVSRADRPARPISTSIPPIWPKRISVTTAASMESNAPFETTEENVAPTTAKKVTFIIIKTPIYDPVNRVIGTQCIFWDGDDGEADRAGPSQES